MSVPPPLTSRWRGASVPARNWSSGAARQIRKYTTRKPNVASVPANPNASSAPSGSVARLPGQRRRAFDADEAEHREGERAHDPAIAEPGEIELPGIDHGAALEHDDGRDGDQNDDGGDFQDQPETCGQTDVAIGGDAG